MISVSLINNYKTYKRLTLLLYIYIFFYIYIYIPTCIYHLYIGYSSGWFWAKLWGQIFPLTVTPLKKKKQQSGNFTSPTLKPFSTENLFK